MRTCLLAVLAFVLLSAAPAASGDGGPSPGAVTGWDGVLASNGVSRYVALSVNGASPNGAITHRVRAYALVRGKLVPGSIVARREPDEQMQGSPVTRATSSDGGWAYTLYARQVGKPFVHALDTRHRRAFCVDIPWAGYNQQTLNGIHLRAARGRVVLHDYSGTLAAIDTHTWKVKS